MNKPQVGYHGTPPLSEASPSTQSAAKDNTSSDSTLSSVEEITPRPIWDCRICGFGVVAGRALDYIRENGSHPNAHGNDSPNAGIAYCPYCDDETLRCPSAARRPNRLIAMLEAAHVLMCEAVGRQWDGQPAFKLSIPADPARDTDLLVGDALAYAIDYLKGGYITRQITPVSLSSQAEPPNTVGVTDDSRKESK